MNQSLTPDLLVPVQSFIAAGLANWSITIQKPSGIIGDSGAPDGTFVNAEPGLVGLPCRAAPPSDSRIQAQEIKSFAEILSVQLLHVLIPQALPQMKPNAGLYNHAILVDPLGNSNAYEIMGPEGDSVISMTRLTLRIATL